ncbi:MmcQ/YjbR family DNA-binding protein [Rhodococcus daqingensis]|uniref:MmcQ/YjbR family DNA-binding protein n=1 Tax=Rhodococcus daqingensis TaxID=2479363 RepID=A0ABW2S3I8_9NOCA
MASLDDAAELCRELPGVTEGEHYGYRAWSVAGKAFAWERPFSNADLRRFGDVAPPDGPILAVRTADLNEKEAALAEHPHACFTIPHFDGYPAVLVQLSAATRDGLRDLVLDGWLASAPSTLARAYLDQG